MLADRHHGVWDIGLEANVPYHFEFENNADCRLLLFRNPASAPFWAARSAAFVDVVSSINVTVGTADRYGVVVVNKTGAAGSYALRVTACVPGDVHDLSSGIGHEAVPSLSYYSFTPAVPAWSAVSIRDLFVTGTCTSVRPGSAPTVPMQDHSRNLPGRIAPSS
jgi:hypothetical protein